MTWLRQDFGMNNTKIYVNLLVVTLFLSLLLKQFLFFSILMFLLIIGLVQIFYARKVGEKLDIVPDKKRIRLMKGTANYLELTFQNKGIPIWNGTLIISFQQAIIPIGVQHTISSGLYEVKIPFSIGYKKRVTVKVPIEGEQRGISRIKRLEVQIPHPLTDGSVLLEYKPTLWMDAIVFPTPYKVEDVFTPSKWKQGQFELSSSLFEDPFFPVGTREYAPGDQFHHIHWKASAKMQQLQTKVFTRVANVSVLFVLNVVEKYGVVVDFEEKIEWLASQIEACYKQDIPFSFAINIRSFGEMPFVFLSVGNGEAHRMKVLELLSILSTNDGLIPFEKIITYLDSHVELPAAVYMMTHQLERYMPLLITWEQRTNMSYYSSVRREGGRDE